MENTQNLDQKSLIINQLTQGKEIVKQLQMHLDPSSSTGKLLITELLSSFDNSLLILNSVKLEVEPQISGPIAAIVATESPRSMISGSPGSDFELGDKSKKRKTMPSWTEQVRVCGASGLEGPLDDGYSWRKYGQKDILGAKYPRGYYRCSHRNVQGCLAIKQVQRSDEDPSIFTVTYRGRHTCIQASHLTRGQSPKKQNQDQKRRKSEETFIDFQTGLEVKTEDLDNQEFTCSPFSFPSTSPINNSLEHENNIFSSLTTDNNFMGSLSPPFMSTPTTSESNYFSPYRMNSFTGPNLQTSDSDLNEIISAVTSASNSPILDLDLDLDFPADFDSAFFS